MESQTILWTPLPNGYHDPKHLRLSVFVSPRLESDASSPTLGLFPDWANWPQTLLSQQGGLEFEVSFEGIGSVTVKARLAALSPDKWHAIFDPAHTKVDSFTVSDYSSCQEWCSFDARNVAASTGGLYGKIAASGDLRPPLVEVTGGGELVTAPGNPDLLGPLRSLGLRDVLSFHSRPSLGKPVRLEPPMLDFHQALTTFGSYPLLLDAFGLALRLDVPLPDGLHLGKTPQNVVVQAVPQWTSTSGTNGSNANETINVVLRTVALMSDSRFAAAPLTNDYTNGMLDLSDKKRFSVVDLDVDGAAESVSHLVTSLGALENWVAPLGKASKGALISVPLPALRSTGPAIVWSGWGQPVPPNAPVESGGVLLSPSGTLSAAAVRQKYYSDKIEAWVAWYRQNVLGKTSPPHTYLIGPEIPALCADDLVRGHRFDVLDVSQGGETWQSLHQRFGNYTFGTGRGALEATTADLQQRAGGPLLKAGGRRAPEPEEGIALPGATQQPGAQPSDALYVHEAIARWTGWSLSVPRNGPSISPDDQVDPSPSNPVQTYTDSSGNQNPQLSAEFQVAPRSLPRLRYGRLYRYRARGVDLGGYSVPLSDPDGRTATLPVPHLRHQPVAGPVVVPIAPMVPGEAALLVPIRNFQSAFERVPAPNGRWLFPPKVSEIMYEEHGMLDGYAPLKGINRDKPPTSAAYDYLRSRVDATLASLPGAEETVTAAKNAYTYVPVNAKGDNWEARAKGWDNKPVSTPWLVDPLTRGLFFQGIPIPGNTGWSTEAFITWNKDLSGDKQPAILGVEAAAQGSGPSHETLPGSDVVPAMEVVRLPPAAVANLYVSNLLEIDALNKLGVAWWLAEAAPANKRDQLMAQALLGLNWMLTPYRVIRLVHAVRLPLVAPHFVQPKLEERPYGSVQAVWKDLKFAVDAPSTASVDVEAYFEDPVDDPAKGVPTWVGSTRHAFKLTVPDPAPLGPSAHPMKVVNVVPAFGLSGFGAGAVHTIGDTKHHHIKYTCTGTSRFVEFFRQEAKRTFPSASPVLIDELGLDPGEVVIKGRSGFILTELQQGTDYTVDGAKGEISVLNSAYHNEELDVTWVPTDTVAGDGSWLHVLASARPAAAKVAKVMPAWSISGPSGSLPGKVNYKRMGGFLRVYLERPWFSSGANELLGVVVLDERLMTACMNDPTMSGMEQWSTMMGLDPISVSSQSCNYSASLALSPENGGTPPTFVATAAIPQVPYRAAYEPPPQLQFVLAEAPQGESYQVWPFDVHYDPVSDLWFADVGINLGTRDSAPPPGYFVRLALVRFQPYAFPGAEISAVTVATFAQPVSNRSVLVTQGEGGGVVTVTVNGPAYYGYRPVLQSTQFAITEPDGKVETIWVQGDTENPYAEHPYSYPTGSGQRATSTMAVDIQVQDQSKGLSGDLAWATLTSYGPMYLDAKFSGGPEVTWTGSFELPEGYDEAALRLRISEIDYPTSLPDEVGTSVRRPFVALMPLSHKYVVPPLTTTTLASTMTTSSTTTTTKPGTSTTAPTTTEPTTAPTPTPPTTTTTTTEPTTTTTTTEPTTTTTRPCGATCGPT
jgi:hypothetical protein